MGPLKAVIAAVLVLQGNKKLLIALWIGGMRSEHAFMGNCSSDISALEIRTSYLPNLSFQALRNEQYGWVKCYGGFTPFLSWQLV